MMMNTKQEDKYIGLKWIVYPEPIRGLPIFNTIRYYHNPDIHCYIDNNDGVWDKINVRQ